MLCVNDLNLYLNKDLPLVEKMSLNLDEGERLAIVGESGSGKSITALAIMGLLPHAITPEGSVTYNGQELLTLDDDEMSAYRGNKLGMVFQEPMSALNPIQSIGRQIAEPLLIHNACSRIELKKHVKTLMEMVGLDPSVTRPSRYPHELSGGQKQRVVIAIALAVNPSVLIADEPTTALDASIQLQILATIDELCEKQKTSLLLITHDLPVALALCPKVIVLYAGRIMEKGPIEKVLAERRHPYTRGLYDALPGFLDNRKPLKPIKGSIESVQNRPKGCAFCTRCPKAVDVCFTNQPPLEETRDGHWTACFNPFPST